MRVEVVSKDAGVRENHVKAWVARSIPMHDQRLNYGANVCELKIMLGIKDGVQTSWQNLDLKKKSSTFFFVAY